MLTPENVGPCKVLLEGIVGEGVEITPQVLEDIRPSTISFHLAKHLLTRAFATPGEDPPLHPVRRQLKRIVRRWIDEGYLVAKGGPIAARHLSATRRRGGRAHLSRLPARHAASERRIKAILDPYNPRGSTRFVNFTTRSPSACPTRRSATSTAVVCDSDWEGELGRASSSATRMCSPM